MIDLNEQIAGGSTISKILRHGSVYFIVSALGKGVGILLLPIYTRYLSPSDYGMLSTITSTGGLLAILMSLRLDGAFGRYFFEYNSNVEDLKNLLSSCFWSVLCLGIIVYCLSLFVGYFYYHKVLHLQFAPLIVLGFLTPLISQITLFGTIYYQQTHQSRIVGGAQVLALIGMHLLSVVLLLTTDLTFNAIIIPGVLSALITCTYYIVLNIRRNLLSLTLDFSIVTKILPFGLAMLPGEFANWISGFSDRIILSIYGPFSETGIYSVGYELGKGLSLVTMAIGMVYTPIMYAKLTQNYENGIASLTKPILGLFWLMAMLTFFLSIFAEDILYLFADKKFQEAGPILIIIVCMYFWGGQYIIFANILGFKKKMLLLSSISIMAAMVNLGLNITFVPVFGKLAAAWSTFISTFLYSALIILFGYKYSRPKIDWRGMLKVCLVLGVIFVLYLLIRKAFPPGLYLLLGKTLLIPIALFSSLFLRIFGRYRSSPFYVGNWYSR